MYVRVVLCCVKSVGILRTRANHLVIVGHKELYLAAMKMKELIAHSVAL